MPKDRNITGAAGVYFAAAELSQLGWIAALTRRNAPRTDVLAQRADGSRTIGIQVKTRLSGWFQLGRSIPLPSSEGANEWFVLISLHGPRTRPDFYIVPRNHVVALAYCGNELFLAASPGRDGRPRTTSRVTIKPPDVAPYQERWNSSNTMPIWRLGRFRSGFGTPQKVHPPPVTLRSFARR